MNGPKAKQDIYSFFEASARRHAERTAVIFENTRLTYAELDEQVRRTAAHLRRLGVRPGDRVLMYAPNCVEHYFVFLACAHVGAIFAPANVAFRSREIGFILSNSQPKLAVVHESVVTDYLASAAQAAVAPERVVCVGGKGVSSAPDLFADTLERSDDFGVAPFLRNADLQRPGLIVYTSGSTAAPKGVLHSHASVVFGAQSYADVWGFTADDRGVVVPPLPWTFGLLCSSYAMFGVGSTVILHPRFHPERTLEAIAENKATLFFGSMSMYTKLLDVLSRRNFDLSSMKVWVLGGEPCPDTAVRLVEQRFGQRLIQAWGQSETLSTISMRWDDIDAPRGTAGKVFPGVQAKLVDASGSPVPVGQPGEAYIRSDGLMLGYYNQPELTAQKVTPDGWVRTGDLLVMDEDGYYFVVGRASDMIIRSGANIAPAEVESGLLQIEGILSACVVGVPDPISGEEVVAFVTFDGPPIPETELRGKLGQMLASYKIPSRIVVVDEFPFNVSGKVDRVELKEQAATLVARRPQASG
jgi:acyl-CoA synthetase (AMP-forming)/AMP-acid ligase II